MDVLSQLADNIFHYQSIQGVFDVVKQTNDFLSGGLDFGFLPVGLAVVLTSTLSAVLIYKVVCHLL